MNVQFGFNINRLNTLTLLSLLLIVAGPTMPFWGLPTQQQDSSKFSPKRVPPPATSDSRNTAGPQNGYGQWDTRATRVGTAPWHPSEADVAKAIDSHMNALALSEAGGDKVGQVANHAALAQLLAQHGKVEQALTHIKIAEHRAEKIDDLHVQASVLAAKADAYMPSGMFENATELYRQALSILKNLGEDEENRQAEIETRLGWAYQSRGDIPRALASYEEARKIFVKVRDIDGQIRVALVAGSLYQSIGEFTRAQEEYVRILPHASHEQLARVLVSVAEMLVADGRPKDALIRYNKALSWIAPGKDFELEISILTGMGRSYMTLGAYDTAEEALDLARVKASKTGNRTLEASVLASIGELQYRTAIDSVMEAPQRTYWERSEDPTESFHAGLLAADRLSPAAGPLSPAYFSTKPNRKSLFARALVSYKNALALLRETGDRVGEIGVLTNMGLVYDARGKSSEALNYYLFAIEKLDTFYTLARLEEFRIDIASQSARLYQRAVELSFRKHHLEEAFNLSERSRARAFLDQLGNARIDFAKNAPADFAQREEKLRRENISLQRQLAQEEAKPSAEINAERMRSLQERLSVVRQEYEESVRDLKISSPEYASFLNIAPLTLKEVQESMGSDVTILSYFTTSRMTSIFVITKKEFHVVQVSVEEAELAKVITSFLDFPGEGNEPDSLKSLYSWLIAPVRSELKTSQLIIIPHSVLNDLPFSALTPGGERFLNDNYVISYLPSASVLPYLNTNVKSVVGQVLVMANDQEEGIPQLSHAYEEAQAIASLWNARLLLGADATVSVLKEIAGDYSILHLIAHFDVDPNHPQFSRIILGQGKESDGSLELYRIPELDLGKTSLVVLSGCRGQSGRRSRDDDVTALSREFMFAGASSVIASLWSVDDDATRQFMIAFYSHLKEGLDKAEALRAAQIEVRHTHRNPFYWAGFALIGDPGEVGNSNLKPGKTSNRTHTNQLH
jgi:CHAT domain-containing protein/Tfp pilus assembly protein PilF